MKEVVGLDGHRWEIELGYRQIKQTMLLSKLTLRSKKPALVEQELWGVLLAYNLVIYQMIIDGKSVERILAQSTEFLKVMRVGHEDVD